MRSLLTFGCDKIRVLPTNVGVGVDGRPVKDALAEKILTEEQVFQMFALEDNSAMLPCCGFSITPGSG